MKNLMLTLFFLIGIICNAMAQNVAMYIYRNDGEFNAFLKEDIDSMRYSHLDAAGIYHNEWQMQEIFASDSTYRIPLVAIDSISFVTPPVEYKSNVHAIGDDLLNYLVSHTDSSLTFSPDVPLQLLPNVGDVLVFDKYEEPISEGFYGRNISCEQTTEGWLCLFDGVGLEDLYNHLVIVGKVYSYNKEGADNRRKISAVGNNMRISLPSKIPLFLSINDMVTANNIFGSEQREAPDVDGKVGITLLNPQLTLDYIVCVGEPNIRDYVKLVANLCSDGLAEISGSCSGTYDPEPHWFPGCQWPFNFYGVAGELDFGLYFEANGEVNASYTVPLSVNTTHGFVYREGDGFGSLDKEQHNDYFEIYKDKAEYDLNLNGSLSFGFAGMLSVGLVNKKVASLDLSLKVGPEVSGNYKVADSENGFNTKLYDALKNAEVTQSLMVKLDPGYRIWFKERESFGHPLTGKFFETTHSLLPEIYNMKWAPQGDYEGKLTADVARDVLVPVKLGWTLLDKDGEIYKKEYFSDNYWTNKTWPNPSLSLSLSNLPENYNYKAYPTIRLWNWEIPLNEYAEVMKECPAEKPLEYETHFCPDNNHPHAIDLGLPSGTKWCCMNVGAASPEQYGGYYAWGETTEKSVYSWDTYKYGSGENDCKYIGSDIAGTSYDVAHVRMGAPWRIPSHDQQVELIENCDQTWIQLNGFYGTLVTGKNGGQIFLPAAGERGEGDLNDAGSYGCYWSSSLYPNKTYRAYYLSFISDYWHWNSSRRHFAHNVRAVCP